MEWGYADLEQHWFAGDCYGLHFGSDSRRFLYVGEPDSREEPPVLLLDTDENPYIGVEYTRAFRPTTTTDDASICSRPRSLTRPAPTTRRSAWRCRVGSPRVVVDASTGTVVQRMDFDEFGMSCATPIPVSSHLASQAVSTIRTRGSFGSVHATMILRSGDGRRRIPQESWAETRISTRTASTDIPKASKSPTLSSQGYFACSHSLRREGTRSIRR